MVVEMMQQFGSHLCDLFFFKNCHYYATLLFLQWLNVAIHSVFSFDYQFDAVVHPLSERGGPKGRGVSHCPLALFPRTVPSHCSFALSSLAVPALLICVFFLPKS
jgi:hypothetical protein